MLRRVGFVAALLTACAPAAREAPPPPLPADMAGFDTEIVERIQARVRLLESDRGDAARWRNLGMTYHAHDQIDLAGECYRQSLALAPQEARTQFYLALAEQRKGEIGEAIAGMRRVAKLDPSYLPARWRLGLWLLEDGDVAAARATLEEALPLARDDRSVHQALARAYLQSGTADRAAELLENWLDDHPEDRFGRFLLGTAYRRLGRAEEARRQLGLSEGAQPSWTDPWSEELAAERVGFPARLAAATGLLDSDPGRAVAKLEELRSERPGNVTVLINLGIGYRRLGGYQPSVAALREAVRLEPARGLARFHLALTLAELAARAETREAGARLMAEALEQTERVVELQPTSPKSHAVRGELLARAGRPEEAVESYALAVREPQDPAWLLRLGGLLCQLGRWQEAVPVLASYLERRDADAEGLFLLGVAQANAGRPEAARASLEQALLASPGEPRVLRALDQLEAARGAAAGRLGPGA